MNFYFKKHSVDTGTMLYIPRNCCFAIYSILDRLSIWGKPTVFEYCDGEYLIGWEFGYFEAKEAIEILDGYGFDYNELRDRDGWRPTMWYASEGNGCSNECEAMS